MSHALHSVPNSLFSSCVPRTTLCSKFTVLVLCPTHYTPFLIHVHFPCPTHYTLFLIHSPHPVSHTTFCSYFTVHVPCLTHYTLFLPHYIIPVPQYVTAVPHYVIPFPHDVIPVPHDVAQISHDVIPQFRQSPECGVSSEGRFLSRAVKKRRNRFFCAALVFGP